VRKGYVASVPALPGCVSRATLVRKLLQTSARQSSFMLRIVERPGDPVPQEDSVEYVEL